MSDCEEVENQEVFVNEESLTPDLSHEYFYPDVCEFEVNLKGGRPWGFTVCGGSERHSPLKVAESGETGAQYTANLVDNGAVYDCSIASLKANAALVKAGGSSLKRFSIDQITYRGLKFNASGQEKTIFENLPMELLARLPNGIDSKLMKPHLGKEVEKDGKASLDGRVHPGDYILRINDVECVSVTDAVQLIQSAFRTLTLAIWSLPDISINENDEKTTWPLHGGNVEPSKSFKSAAYLKRARDIQEKDQATTSSASQDDSVVYTESKSCQQVGSGRGKSKPRRVESFCVASTNRTPPLANRTFGSPRQTQNVTRQYDTRANQEFHDKYRSSSPPDTTAISGSATPPAIARLRHENEIQRIRNISGSASSLTEQAKLSRVPSLPTARSTPSLDTMGEQPFSRKPYGKFPTSQSQIPSPHPVSQMSTNCVSYGSRSPSTGHYDNIGPRSGSNFSPSYVIKNAWDRDRVGGAGGVLGGHTIQTTNPPDLVMSTGQTFVQEHKLLSNARNERKYERRSLPTRMQPSVMQNYQNVIDFPPPPLTQTHSSDVSNNLGYAAASDGDSSDSEHEPPEIPPPPKGEDLKRIGPPPSGQPIHDPSSFKFMNQGHEKYPSWPVTRPSVSKLDLSQPGVNSHADSWTDHTNTSSEFHSKQKAQYDRYQPKMRSHRERSSPVPEHKNDKTISDMGRKPEILYHTMTKPTVYDQDNNIVKFCNSQPGYPLPILDPDGHNYGDKDYNVPSPPERDIPPFDPKSLQDRVTSTLPSERELELDHSNIRNKMVLDTGTSMGDNMHNVNSPVSSTRHCASVSQTSSPYSSTQSKDMRGYIVKPKPYYNTSTQTDYDNDQVTLDSFLESNKDTRKSVQTQVDDRNKSLINANDIKQYQEQSIQARLSWRSGVDRTPPQKYQTRNNQHSKLESDKQQDQYSQQQMNQTQPPPPQEFFGAKYSETFYKPPQDGSIGAEGSSNNIPVLEDNSYITEYTPMLRKLSEEMYRQQYHHGRALFPNPMNDKRLSTSSQDTGTGSRSPVSPNTSVGQMKPAESYSSILIHPDASCLPFGRDDWGSQQSLASDVRSVDMPDPLSPSELRKAMKKGRYSLDSTILPNKQVTGPIFQTIPSDSGSNLNRLREAYSSSPGRDSLHQKQRQLSLSDLRAGRVGGPMTHDSLLESVSSGTSHPKSSSSLGSHSSRSSSELALSPGPYNNNQEVLPLNNTQSESLNDSVFPAEDGSQVSQSAIDRSKRRDASSPLVILSGCAKTVDGQVTRKQSMKKAYGIFDEAEKTLSSSAKIGKQAKTWHSLQDAKQDMSKGIVHPRSQSYTSHYTSPQSYHLAQIQESSEPTDPEWKQSRSHEKLATKSNTYDNYANVDELSRGRKGKDSHVNRAEDRVFNSKMWEEEADEQTNNRKTVKSDNNLKRISSDNMKSGKGKHKTRPSESTQEITENHDVQKHCVTSDFVPVSPNTENESGIKQVQQDALLKFIHRKTSENSANSSKVINIDRSSSLKHPRLKNYENYADLSKVGHEMVSTHLDMQNSAQPISVASERSESQSLLHTTALSEAVLDNGNVTRGVFRDSSRVSDKSQVLSPNTEEVSHSSLLTKSVSGPITAFSREEVIPKATKQEAAVMISDIPGKSTRRPAPPVPVESDDRPPDLPPRNYNRRSDENIATSPTESAPIVPVKCVENFDNNTETSANNNNLITLNGKRKDVESLRNMFENSPREDVYRDQIRKQARRLSEQQQISHPMRMQLAHSKQEVSISHSYARLPTAPQEAVSPVTTGPSLSMEMTTPPPIRVPAVNFSDRHRQPCLTEQTTDTSNLPIDTYLTTTSSNNSASSLLKEDNSCRISPDHTKEGNSTPTKEYPVQNKGDKSAIYADRSPELPLPSPPKHRYEEEAEEEVIVGLTEFPPPPPEVITYRKGSEVMDKEYLPEVEDAADQNSYADDSYGSYRNNRPARQYGVYKRSVSSGDASLAKMLEGSSGSNTPTEGDSSKTILSRPRRLENQSWRSAQSLSSTSFNKNLRIDSGSYQDSKFSPSSPSPPDELPTTAQFHPPHQTNYQMPMDRNLNHIEIHQRMDSGYSSSRSSTKGSISDQHAFSLERLKEDKYGISKIQESNSNYQQSSVKDRVSNFEVKQPPGRVVISSVTVPVIASKVLSQQALLTEQRNNSNHVREIKNSFETLTKSLEDITEGASDAGSSSSSQVQSSKSFRQVPREPPHESDRPGYNRLTENGHINNNNKHSVSRTGIPVNHRASKSDEIHRPSFGMHASMTRDSNNDVFPTRTSSLSEITNTKLKYSRSAVSSNDKSILPVRVHPPSSLPMPVPHNNSAFTSDNTFTNFTNNGTGHGVTIIHRRHKSLEELECDEHAEQLAKELKVTESDDVDLKLLNVISPPSEQKNTMDYMNGLFTTSTSNVRRISSECSPSGRSSLGSTGDSPRELTKKEQSPIPPTSPYWMSPARASLENSMREGEKEDIIQEVSGEPHALVQKKEELLKSIMKKLDVLREEKVSLQHEIAENNDVGDQLLKAVEQKSIKDNEKTKFKCYIDDLEKIVRLLLKLSGLLARAQNAVNCLPADADKQQRVTLTEKYQRLSDQHEEAKDLKQDIDRRRDHVCVIIKQHLTDNDLKNFSVYVDMKSQLTIEFQELEDKIVLGDEQLTALKKTMPITS